MSFLGEERVQGKYGDLEEVRQPEAENKSVVTSEMQVEGEGRSRCQRYRPLGMK